MDVNEQLMTLLLQGRCCAEAIVEAGLELRGEQNDALVRAAGGLCMGLGRGHACGALAAGALLLSLFDPARARSDLVPALSDWFSDTYGTVNCRDIAGEHLEHKPERCFGVLVGVYEKCLELLDEACLLDGRGRV